MTNLRQERWFFNQKKLDDYFEPNMSSEDIEELIVRLLDEWKQKGEG